jgi:hypothetical protein
MFRLYNKDDAIGSPNREGLARVLDGYPVHDGVVLVGPLFDYAAAD